MQLEPITLCAFHLNDLRIMHYDVNRAILQRADFLEDEREPRSRRLGLRALLGGSGVN